MVNTFETSRCLWLLTSFICRHYVVCGPESTPYEGGFYHGKLIFPKEFPFKPPAIYMTTPNGRFRTNTRLCLSISDFHPDTWNPAWSVSTILMALLSFMVRSSGLFIMQCNKGYVIFWLLLYLQVSCIKWIVVWCLHIVLKIWCFIDLLDDITWDLSYTLLL